MGLFDEFEVEVTCPKCHRTFMTDMQSKCLIRVSEFHPKQVYFKQGTFVSKMFRFIYGIATCPDCSTNSSRCIVCNHLSVGKHYNFDVVLFIDEDGNSSGKTEVLDDNSRSKYR